MTTAITSGATAIDDQLALLKEERDREKGERMLMQGVLEDLMECADEPGAAGERDAFIASLRKYNHFIIEEFARMVPLAGARILDIGASPHGFAMERALRHKVAEYVGIGLDMPFEPALRVGPHTGRLLRMNAESLDIEAGSFDAALSISTFEHIAHPDVALIECHRVLRPGGKLLLVFEPIWTSSYGHHLHHFGEVSKIVPDWTHLLWSREEMTAFLVPRWPSGAPLSVQQAVDWIYESDALNRIGIERLRKIVDDSPFEVEWVVPLPDEACDRSRLPAAVAHTGLSEEDLLTRGFSMLLRR